MAEADDDSLFSEVGNFISQSEKLHDVYFLVGCEKERIGATKLFLINQSRVWWSMLSPDSPLVETADILLPDIEPAMFKLLLKHCYGGLDDLRDLSEDTVVQLCYCADKYLMASLTRKIEARLKPDDEDDLFAALHCLTRYNLDGVKYAVTKIVQTQTKKLFAHPEFMKCDVESIVFIAQQDKLNCNELELWRAIVKWAKHKVDSSDESKLRQVMSEPLKHIRLLTLSDVELRQALADGILNATQVMNVCIQDVDGLEDLCGNMQLRKRPPPQYRNHTCELIHSSGGFSKSRISSSCIVVGRKDIFLQSVTCRNSFYLEKFTSHEHALLNKTCVEMSTNIKITRITNHINNTSSETPVDIELTNFKMPFFDQFKIPTIVNNRGVLLKANCRYRIDLDFNLCYNDQYRCLINEYMICWSRPECYEGHDFGHGIFYCSLSYNKGKGMTLSHILQLDYSVADD